MIAGPTHENGVSYYQAWYTGTRANGKGNKTYTIYVTHLTQEDYVKSGESGDIMGKICRACLGDRSHLHIELGISQGGNTDYVRPEDYLLCQ